jgi:SAM-dependent methyltransferase
MSSADRSAPGFKANLERWSAEDEDWRGYRYIDGRLVLEQRVERVLDLVRPVPSGSLLDIGCATGIISQLMAERAGLKNVVGVDVVHRPTAIPVVVANLDSRDSLPFATASFDIVTCLETLEHVHDTDHLISEVRRVLKVTGYALFSVPRLDGFLAIGMLALGFQPPAVECSVRARYGSPERNTRVSGHVSHFTRRALAKLLTASGFEVEAFTQAGIYSSWLLAAKTPPLLWKRLPLWLLSKVPVKQDVQIVRARPR